MINFIAWVIGGGLLGWSAGKIMRTDAQQGTVTNIVVGGVGALIAGWAVTPLFGIVIVHPGSFNIQALAVSLLGALILLAVLNFSGTVHAVKQN